MISTREILQSTDHPWPGLFQNHMRESLAHLHSPLPKGSVIIGMGNDRSPVLFNLGDPVTGAILIIGEAGSGKTKLLHSILQSAALLYTDQVSISMIANEHYSASHFGLTAMRLDLCRPYSPEAAENVSNLVLLAKKRLAKASKLPFILLAIEDLAQVYERFSPKVQEELIWLLQNGPKAGIWPLCTITPSQTSDSQIPDDVLKSFNTHLWGHIQSPGVGFGLDSAEAAPLSCLIPGREFCLRLDSGWLCFWIIDPYHAAITGLHPSCHVPNNLFNATRGGHHEYWHVMV
jgi:hypothetical protein